MYDSNAAELLEELNGKRRMISTWPFAVVACVSTGVLAIANSSNMAWWWGFGLLVPTIFLAIWCDRKRKTTILFYDLQPPVLPAVEAMHSAFDQLCACSRAWHVDAEAFGVDKKYHAGAEATIRRHSISLGRNAPAYVKTNVAVARIPAGKQTLYLFPDRVLVYDPNGIGTVPYDQLQLSIETTRFVESDSVPADTRVVDRTWRYVNKKGGPDRRFSNNTEIPIVLYEELNLRSGSGLNERLQLSRCGASEAFIVSVRQLANTLQNNPQHAVPPIMGTSPEQARSEMPPVIAERSTFRAPTVDSSAIKYGGRKFFYFAGSVVGPINRAELDAFVAQGNLSPDTLVCTDDNSNWRPYKELDRDVESQGV